MPHINLLYPFITDDPSGEAFSAAADILTPVLAEVAPFWIRFDAESFRFFRHGKNCTLWLKPQAETERQSGEIVVFNAVAVCKLMSVLIFKSLVESGLEVRRYAPV